MFRNISRAMWVSSVYTGCVARNIDRRNRGSTAKRNVDFTYYESTSQLFDLSMSIRHAEVRPLVDKTLLKVYADKQVIQVNYNE